MSTLLSALITLVGVIASAVIADKRAKYVSEKSYREFREKLYHEDQTRKEQWAHEKEKEDQQAAAAKDADYLSTLASTLASISAYLNQPHNLRLKTEATSAVNQLIVKADDKNKPLLQNLLICLEAGDISGIKRLRAEVQLKS